MPGARSILIASDDDPSCTETKSHASTRRDGSCEQPPQDQLSPSSPDRATETAIDHAAATPTVS